MITTFRCMVVLAIIVLGTNATQGEKAMSSGIWFYKKYPLFRIVPLGDNVRFNCSTNGTNVTTQLLKDGVSLPSKRAPKLIVKKNGDIFTIIDFDISDTGKYKCGVLDSTGSTIKWSDESLLIPRASKLYSMSVYPRYRKYKSPGKDASFTCKGSTGTTLTWYKMDGTRIPANKVKIVNDPFEKQAVLTIKNAQASDSGKYKCVIRYRGKQKHDLVELKVLSMSGIWFYKRYPRILPVPLGENFKINCSTNGTNVTTQLLKDGVSLPSKRAAFANLVVKKNGDIFTIVNFGLRESGSYKCRARDSSGATIKWRHASLLIPDPRKLPSMSVYPRYLEYKAPGKDATFTCKSSYATTLTWYKMDGTRISANKVVTVKGSFQKEAVLTIKNAQTSDSGKYKCVLRYRGQQKHDLTELKVL